jgi:hypothetical protein
MGVDHFGKAVETGTRGSSAKEAAADTVLAMLGNKDEAGNVSNTRMAVRKVRGARTGMETPYDLEVVEIGRDQYGDPITTCIVTWQESRAEAAAAAIKERWPATLKVFRQAMATALDEHGVRAWPFGATGQEERATPFAKVRTVFYATYPADGADEAKRSEAKRKAFNRSVKMALDKGLIGSVELSGVDHLWTIRDASTS